MDEDDLEDLWRYY